MKKILLIILVLFAIRANSQIDTIKNFQWNKENIITCFYQKCSTCTEVNRNIDADSLGQQFSSLRYDFEAKYNIKGDTIDRVLYQNKSQSFTGYERCWVFYKHSKQLELQLNELPQQLQVEYYMLSEKIKKVIFKRGY